MNSNFPTKNVEDYLVCARGDELPNQEIFGANSKFIHFHFSSFYPGLGVRMWFLVYG